MQSVLLKFACVAVMFHMTFGCSWHHGVGESGCSVHANNGCQHVGHQSHTVGTHRHDHLGHCHVPNSQPSPNEDGQHENGQHDDHSGCPGDHCNATQSIKFEFLDSISSVPQFNYLSRLNRAAAQTVRALVSKWTPDRWIGATGMRAHLYLGVLIL